LLVFFAAFFAGFFVAMNLFSLPCVMDIATNYSCNWFDV